MICDRPQRSSVDDRDENLDARKVSRRSVCLLRARVHSQRARGTHATDLGDRSAGLARARAARVISASVMVRPRSRLSQHRHSLASFRFRPPSGPRADPADRLPLASSLLRTQTSQSLDATEADHNVARVERMTLGERRAVIERDGKEAWKWLEWSAMKVRFAKEVLRDAEGDHARRKVEFDALAAALEENNEATRRLDEKIKKLEGTLGVAGRREAVAATAARSARAAGTSNGDAPESRAPPAQRAPAPVKAKKDDTDHLRDGYAKAYIKKPFFPVRKRASAAAEAPRVSDIDARSEPSAPPLAERERDPPTTASKSASKPARTISRFAAPAVVRGSSPPWSSRR